MGRNLLIGFAALLLIGLAIGIFWTVRLGVPKPTPWWYGKDPVVRVQVWERGKDMPTFAMTMPKKTLDALYVMGLKQTIDVDGKKVELNRIWQDLQRLPKGEKLRFQEDEAIVTIWIEVKGAASDAVPDTSLAPGDTAGAVLF